MKKLGAIVTLLLLFLLCGLFARGAGEKAVVESKAEPGALFGEPVTLSLLLTENQSWPYRKDWYIVDLIKRKTNISFDVQLIATDYNNKLAIVVASGDIPDIVWLWPNNSLQHGQQGAFINVFDHLDQTPNFEKWMKAGWSDGFGPLISGEGKMYVYPNLEVGETEREGWFYRKDIFEKHNLQVPVNEQEFYQVLKKLKQLYPDSYPLSFRRPLYRLFNMAPQFGARMEYYYDEGSDSWKYGPIEDNMKDMVAYFHKLHDEELLTPDFLSISTQSWVEQVSAGKAFITFDWLTRMDFFNKPMRELVRDFTMFFMPPWKGGPRGQRKIEDTLFYGVGPGIASNSKNMKKALAYVDWLWSDEARDLISWGEEGITHELVDGKKKFLDVTEPNELWRETGIMTYGFFGRYDVQANISLASPELAYGLTEGHKYDMAPLLIVNFLPEEQEIDSTIGQAIETRMEEQISKFIIGMKDMAEWDQYVQEIQNLGLDRMLSLHTTAHKRVKQRTQK